MKSPPANLAMAPPPVPARIRNDRGRRMGTGSVAAAARIGTNYTSRANPAETKFSFSPSIDRVGASTSGNGIVNTEASTAHATVPWHDSPVSLGQRGKTTQTGPPIGTCLGPSRSRALQAIVTCTRWMRATQRAWPVLAGWYQFIAQYPPSGRNNHCRGRRSALLGNICRGLLGLRLIPSAPLPLRPIWIGLARRQPPSTVRFWFGPDGWCSRHPPCPPPSSAASCPRCGVQPLRPLHSARRASLLCPECGAPPRPAAPPNNRPSSPLTSN